MLRIYSVRYVLVIFMIQLLVLPVNAAVYSEVDPFKQFVAVSAGELASLRGGYSARNGLEFSFGIRQVTYIDGALYAATVLNFTQLGVAPVQTAVQPQLGVAPVETAVQPQVGVAPVEIAVQPQTGVPTVEIVAQPQTGVPAVEVAVQPQAGVPAVEVAVQPQTGVPAVSIAVQPQTGVPAVETAVQPQVAVAPVQAMVQAVKTVPNSLSYSPAVLSAMQTQLVNLIQNNQNQRTLDHRTIIDISVNSLKVFRELSLSSLFQQQLDANLFR